ncbi:hypothetical protein ARMSODRAFT_1009951 [Armillaria solidipes]|uniref:Uncharacterized protein n=1 Tax=Armillaria solidipes TaxID=1076256 RepID=A0A2H3B4W2_9AGAR|nr:hypothetical protein ARMSODRAFT_1009951 [Armillaria solidipes]
MDSGGLNTGNRPVVAADASVTICDSYTLPFDHHLRASPKTLEEKELPWPFISSTGTVIVLVVTKFRWTQDSVIAYNQGYDLQTNKRAKNRLYWCNIGIPSLLVRLIYQSFLDCRKILDKTIQNCAQSRIFNSYRVNFFCVSDNILQACVLWAPIIIL